MKIENMVIYGDSISTTEFSGGGYEAGLKARLALKSLKNYAVSATSLCAISEKNEVPTSGIRLARENPPAADTELVLVWYGTNDWYWGAALGTLAEKSDDTFFGAMDEIVSIIRSNAPNAKIVWLTPVFRVGLEGSSQDAYDCPNASGHTLFDFYKAVKEGCDYYALQCLDMHVECNIHHHNREALLADGVHPSLAGYKVVLDTICNYLEKLQEKPPNLFKLFRCGRCGGLRRSGL